MLRHLLLLAALCGAGCDDNGRERRRLGEELDYLVRERGYLAAHQANLRLAADAELAGRPPDALPPDAQTRVAVYQQQFQQADLRRRGVDLGIEFVQSQLAALP